MVDPVAVKNPNLVMPVDYQMDDLQFSAAIFKKILYDVIILINTKLWNNA